MVLLCGMLLHEIIPHRPNHKHKGWNGGQATPPPLPSRGRVEEDCRSPGKWLPFVTCMWVTGLGVKKEPL